MTEDAERLEVVELEPGAAFTHRDDVIHISSHGHPSSMAATAAEGLVDEEPIPHPSPVRIVAPGGGGACWVLDTALAEELPLMVLAACALAETGTAGRRTDLEA
jgi:hypothetical protein